MKKYLVKIVETVGDEDEAVLIFIASEKALNELKNSKCKIEIFQYSNCEDSSFESIAKVTEITEEECNLLHKLNLNVLETGYFRFYSEGKDSSTKESVFEYLNEPYLKGLENY